MFLGLNIGENEDRKVVPVDEDMMDTSSNSDMVQGSECFIWI